MPGNLTAKSQVLIDAKPDEVWSALTDPATLGKAMFGATVKTGWHEGDPITFSGQWQGKFFEDKGKVVKLVPGQTLVITHWSPLSGTPDVPENYHTVTIQLAAGGNGTELTLSQDNVMSENELKHSEANWDTMLGTLKELVERR